MRKTRKIIGILLISAILTGLMTSVAFANAEQMLDPFNNEMFSVIKEIPFEEGDYLGSKMADYYSVFNDDYSMEKIVYGGYNDNGEKFETDITDFMSSEECSKKYDELEDGYNDGLLISMANNEYGEYVGTYTDFNNNVVFSGMKGQGYDYGYNIGLLRDSYGAMNMDTGEYDDVFTTFTSVMTDQKKYSFNADFTDFNDNGYAIMQKNGKSYLIRLNKGFIVTVTYNGEKIKFDQIPVIESGRTLVPLRAIFEKLGAAIDWNGDTQTVTASKDGTTISLTIGDTNAVKNGETITLDVPSKLVNGRTLVPVRFIADSFGVNVDWDGDMQRVLLTSN